MLVLLYDKIEEDKKIEDKGWLSNAPFYLTEITTI